MPNDAKRKEVLSAKRALVVQIQSILGVMTAGAGAVYVAAAREISGEMNRNLAGDGVWVEPGAMAGVAPADLVNRKVTSAQAADACGVGRNTISAVKAMMGIAHARKVYVSPIRAFLKRYPDFQIRDAADIPGFAKRHPEYVQPRVAGV